MPNNCSNGRSVCSSVGCPHSKPNWRAHGDPECLTDGCAFSGANRLTVSQP